MHSHDGVDQDQTSHRQQNVRCPFQRNQELTEFAFQTRNFLHQNSHFEGPESEEVSTGLMLSVEADERTGNRQDVQDLQELVLPP